MSPVRAMVARRAVSVGAMAAVAFYVAANAYAHPVVGGDGPVSGRIDFDVAKLPPAGLEIDLSNDTIGDLLGLGEAALAGMAESLLRTIEQDQRAEGTRLAAEQLAAARQVLQLASEVVREVRIRAYRDLPEEHAKPDALALRFDDQLRAGNWDNVLRAREGNQAIRVALLRHEGAVRGVFVIAGQGSELALVNVVCDISPENVKRLTAAATRVGLENGLAPLIESRMRDLRRRSHTPAEPPVAHPTEGTE